MNDVPQSAAIARPGRSPSLMLRLTVLVTAILLLLAAIALFLARQYGHRAADEAYDKLLTGASLQIAERVSVSDGAVVADIPYSAFELLALARDDRVFYRVIGLSGETLTGHEDLPTPEQAALAPADIYNIRYSGEWVRVAVARRPISEPGLSGTVRVLVGQTVSERRALANDIALKAAYLIATIAAAAIGFALFGVRYALAPLTKVQRALLSRNPNDLSPFAIETPRELETVVSALNRFILRLDHRVQQVQAFVADAAHQLRTPIAAIRAQAELATGENSPERLKRINRRILDRSIAVGRLADQLLSRAMITHRSDAAALAPVDLRRIAIEAERESQRFADSEEPIRCELWEHPIIVLGDAFSLREAVKNLINNAQSHGKPPLRICVFEDGGEAWVAIRDHGPGIAAELREKIGSRFAGVDFAGASKTGLGLAIAADVAQFHSGRLACAQRPDGEFEIAMILPATSVTR